jgi:hypothetical protein
MIGAHCFFGPIGDWILFRSLIVHFCLPLGFPILMKQWLFVHSGVMNWWRDEPTTCPGKIPYHATAGAEGFPAWELKLSVGF